MERIVPEGISLRTRNASDRIALRGVRVHARLAGMSQRTTVEQAFVNLELRAIEAVYTFPLPEGAAVCAFDVVTGDRVLTGTIDENDAVRWLAVTVRRKVADIDAWLDALASGAKPTGLTGAAS